MIEGYTKPIVLICVEGPCLERDSLQVIGPGDIHGNLPPEPESGEPELFYSTIEIDGMHYWDPTREPYQISEEAENAETTPEGYKLEDIDGQLLLVLYGNTQEDRPADEIQETVQQETFIIYTVIEVEGGRNYLEPTPFHAHRVDSSVDEPVTTGVDPQENQQSEGPQGTQDGLDIQGGQGDTFASLDGKFYQSTSDPASFQS